MGALFLCGKCGRRTGCLYVVAIVGADIIRPLFLCVYPRSHFVTAPLDKNKGSQVSSAVAGLHRLPYLFHKPVDGVGQFGEHFRIAVLHGVNDTVLQVVLEDHLAGAV